MTQPNKAQIRAFSHNEGTSAFCCLIEHFNNEKERLEQMSGGVSQEQIARAKEVTITDYILSREPNNVKRVGSALYLRDHNSLEISNNLWLWHSQGIGGKNVIDYLMKVRGYGFVDAVRQLAGYGITTQRVTPTAKPPPQRKAFELPPKSRDNMRVIAYLQSRGIELPLILSCIGRGILYESSPHHNCVFVGRDEDNTARYAALRGTLGNFKCDAVGSDKRFGFTLPPIEQNSNCVAVFESAVDVLSHKMLFPEFDGYRLSLGGTGLAALTHFLECHTEIKSVVFCTDNDRAGELAASKFETMSNREDYAALSGIVTERVLPSVGKDWNEELLALQKAERLQGRERLGGITCL